MPQTGPGIKKNEKLLDLALTKFLEGTPIEAAAEIADAVPCTIYRAKQRVKTYGRVYAPKSEYVGRPLELDDSIMEWLRLLLEGQPELYLDEMRDQLEEVYDKSFSISTISRRLKEVGWNKATAIKTARERNAAAREHHTKIMKGFVRAQLVFVDESAENERVGDRKRLWGLRAGSGRAVSTKPFHPKGEKYSILPAFTCKGFLCSDIVQGNFDAHSFYIFLRDTLLPLCNPYPEEKSVILMDNCVIHRAPEVRELVESFGCKLIYLPPYSPDYNPVEWAFGILKKWIARYSKEFDLAVEGDYIPQFLERAMDHVDEEASEWSFGKSGL